MFWLAEQSHRQSERARISAVSEWVSCIDRKLGAFMRAMHWFPTTPEKRELPVEKNATSGAPKSQFHCWYWGWQSDFGLVPLVALLLYNWAISLRKRRCMFYFQLLTEVSCLWSKRKLHSQGNKSSFILALLHFQSSKYTMKNCRDKSHLYISS